MLSSVKSRAMGSLQQSPPLSRRRVVLVPYPFQGHITPMIQLGSILNSKGFSIVIAHTEFNSPTLENHPEFTFLPLSDNISGFDTSSKNMCNVILALNKNCRAQFEEDMVRQREEEEVSCIIYDPIMRFVDEVAKLLKLPTIVLRTTTAAFIQSHDVMFQLREKKLIPCPESQLHDPVPDSYPLRFQDLPHSALLEKIPDDILEFLLGYIKVQGSAFIWNTVDILDHSSLHKLQQQHDQVPFFPIGPFHKLDPSSQTSLMKEDTTCLSWLDKQAHNSVIYVSLGSLATIEEKDFIEMAWGLANSEQPFLWVIRPSLVIGSEWIECLPEEFKEKTRERGRIVKWAPQKKVLAHSSVGGFFSHCGWNSTLESICEGVPMICRPCFTDQIVNARYLTHVWKIAIELQDFGEMSIEKAVRSLMEGEEGKQMRLRVVDMKQELESATREGGSSHKALGNLVEFIMSLGDAK